MRILVVSDFHGSLEASEKTASKARSIRANVVTISGDITNFGSVKEAERLLAPLVSLGSPLLYVAGNCDPSQLAQAQINGALNLHATCQTYENVSFIGVAGAPRSHFYSWFELSETEIMNLLRQAVDHCQRSERLVVVSHFPPKDTKLDTAFLGVHAGSVSLRKFVEEKKPDIVFCGHIHEARGIDHIGETLIINPGPARHGNCAIVDLGEDIDVKLDSL